MVLGHQSLLSNMSGSPPGLQPALQLAAVAAHLAPRSRPWAPFLQFGQFPMFAPFLTRPHFGGPPQHNLLNINNSTSNSSHSSSLSSQRNLQSPPSEDSNDERGEKIIFFKFDRRAKPLCLWSAVQCLRDPNWCQYQFTRLSASACFTTLSPWKAINLDSFRERFRDFQLKPIVTWLHFNWHLNDFKESDCVYD